MDYLSQEQFLSLCKKGNLVPVYKEIMGDLDTPVSAYYKIAEEAEHSFLLESVEGEEKVARFSFLAKNPELVVESKNDRVVLTEFKGAKRTQKEFKLDDSPLSVIRDIMSKYKFVNIPNLPRFCGGLVGYLSYDTIRHFETIPAKTKDDLKLPEMLMMLAKDLIIFDHLNHRIKIISCALIDPDSSDSAKIRHYKKAIKSIDQLILELNRPLQVRKNKNGRNASKSVELKVKSNLSEAEFKNIVSEAKKQIRAGEIIQVVLSQRFEVDLKTDPFNIYRALRSLNPSPYMYCLKFNGIQIIGSSPELLVRCEDGIVETRPIAGTRKRGKK